MIPLRDTLRSRSFPVVTVGIIGLCALVFFEQWTAGPRGAERLVLAYGLIPARFIEWHELIRGRELLRWLPLFTSMFLHGGLLHLFGNLLYLWIFGDNVEDLLGHTRFFLFYVTCGAIAGLTQVVFDPLSPLPTIGASGAIAGVLGAYLVSFPRSRVLTLVPIWIIPWVVELPAVIYLVLWFALQLVSALAAVGREWTGGVAWWAHVGGFLAGVLLVLLLGPRRNYRKPASR